MPAHQIIMAAFDRGQIPTIACINQATVSLGVDFDKLIAALQKFLDDYYVPVWGTPATLVKATLPQPGAWTMVFLDNADAANALGYHELTKYGLPLSKVFVRPTQAVGNNVSTTACHELAEMMVDPAINLWADGPNHRLYAYETCDAVEEEEFLIDGVPMSDFVYPSYFEAFRGPGSTQFDHMSKVSRPFEILPGGYSLVRDGAEVKAIFGSAAKKHRFNKEDRRQHRSEYRRHLLEVLQV